MFCPNCGAKLDGEVRFCGSCGSPLNVEQLKIYSAEGKTNENQVNIPGAPAPKSGTTFVINKKIVGALAVVIVVLVVVAGVASYFNSDSYKTEQAVGLVVSGDYFEGAKKIQDVYTPQAFAIINFIDVEKAKDKFVNLASTDDLEDTIEAFWDFRSKTDEFKDSDEFLYLDETLKSHYYCYKYAFDFVSEFLGTKNRSLSAMFTNVQSVMMNEVSRNNSSKNGDTFTLNELHNRVDISTSALKSLKEVDFSGIEIKDANVITYCHTSSYTDEDGYKAREIFLGAYLLETINTLIEECELEIYSSQERIEESAEEFKMDAKLYKTYPISDYSSYVGANLEEIKTYDDISENEATLIGLIRRDVMYYLITGSCVAYSE